MHLLFHSLSLPILGQLINYPLLHVRVYNAGKILLDGLILLAFLLAVKPASG